MYVLTWISLSITSVNRYSKSNKTSQNDSDKKRTQF